MMDAFAQEGYHDALEGVERTECPYQEGTDGQEGWLAGWQQGQRELERTKSY